MNIFYLDHDPKKAARMLAEKHVVKMIIESAQMLSTAHRVLDGQQKKVTKSKVKPDGSIVTRTTKEWVMKDLLWYPLYKATHINHPCNIWVRECTANYRWLFDHFVELCTIYTEVYGKVHKTAELTNLLSYDPVHLKLGFLTPPALAMEEIYKSAQNPTTSYINYYVEEKLKTDKVKFVRIPMPETFKKILGVQ